MNLKKNGSTIGNCHDTGLSHCRKVVFAILSLAILLFLVYSNSFDCSWQFDDEPNITHNPNLHLEKLTWPGIKRAIFSDRNNPGFPYRPVAGLSFALNYYFGGKDVFGYHLVNLVIHWLSAVFLFLFIYHTLNLPQLKHSYGPSSYGLALLATVFWAINPVQVQAVTYIVQRMASLAGMFFILSMYLYLKARTSTTSWQSALFLGLCFASFLLAIGAKENAAMLPLVVFIYEALLIQKNPGRFLRKNLALILIVFAFTLLLGLGYLYFKGGNVFTFLESYGTTRPFTLKERLLTESRVIFLYVSLLLYPLTERLNIAHSIDLSKSLINPASTLFAVIAIIILIVVALYSARRKPLLSFCILFFFVNHLIESSIFPLELIYEHRNYIPSMLLFLLISIGVIALFEHYKTKRTMRAILLVFLVLIMVGFGHAAHLRNMDWKTPEILWVDALSKSPDMSRPYHNIARIYHQRGDLDRALELYNEALKKPPTNRNNEIFITYYNLGNLFMALEEFEKSESFFRRALSLEPSHGPTYNNLASLFEKQGKYDIADEYALKAFQKWPGDPGINLNLGLLYLKRGNHNEAIPHLKMASASGQLRKSALPYLAIAYMKKGLRGRAAVLFQASLRENPRDIMTHLHLAEVYQRAGHNLRAEKEAQRAIRLIPDNHTFQKIIDDLMKTGPSKNINPDAEIVIPLLHKAGLEKISIITDWNETLEGIL